MANSTIKKITTRAKQIRRLHPNMAWLSCIKKAGAEYRGGKIAGTGKKKRPSAVKKRRVAAVAPKKIVKTNTIRTTIGRAKMVGTVASHTQAAKKILEEQLAWMLLNISQAKKVSVRKKLVKKAAGIKKKLRGLSA